MSQTVGIDVGGTAIKAVRIDEHGRVEASHEQATPSHATGWIEAVISTAERLGPGSAVGLGCAGLVDRAEGVMVWSPHLAGEDVEIESVLRSRLGVAVVVDNDANMAATAEHRLGAGIGHDNMVMITLGTGIGMGLILDGEVRRGRAHAGEVGHVTADPAGKSCRCGRHGCWETKVSGSRLDAEAAELFGGGAEAPDLVAAALAGHSRAIEILRDAGEWLAWGVEALALSLDPSMVVVGGAVAGAGDLLLDPVRVRLSTTEGSKRRPPFEVRTGILGSRAGAVGAALYAADL